MFLQHYPPAATQSFSACGSSKPLPYGFETDCEIKQMLVFVFYALCLSPRQGGALCPAAFRRSGFMQSNKFLQHCAPCFVNTIYVFCLRFIGLFIIIVCKKRADFSAPERTVSKLLCLRRIKHGSYVAAHIKKHNRSKHVCRAVKKRAPNKV